MSNATLSHYPRHWRKPAFIASRYQRWGWMLAATVYLVLALASLEINWARLSDGLARGWLFVGAFLQPNFSDRQGDIIQGFKESLTMTVGATALGVLLSIPVAIGAARNLAPLWVYLLCRGFIAISRTLNEIIVATELIVF